jgi:hypothetical protein
MGAKLPTCRHQGGASAALSRNKWPCMVQQMEVDGGQGCGLVLSLASVGDSTRRCPYSLAGTLHVHIVKDN